MGNYNGRPEATALFTASTGETFTVDLQLNSVMLLNVPGIGPVRIEVGQPGEPK